MDIPLLPGNSFRYQKKDFRKSQLCNHRFGSKCVDNEAWHPQRRHSPSYMKYVPNEFKSAEEAWFALDGTVLRFFGYFEEKVEGHDVHTHRIRRVNILFYVCDDTIQISEPRVDNAASVQGVLFSRNRIKKGNGDEFFGIETFNVGITWNVLSRSIHITGCDDFTRRFLKSHGVNVPKNMDLPSDEYLTKRKERDAAHMQFTVTKGPDKLARFLEHDKLVLRFFCVWDDSSSPFGDVREFIVHFFVEDDTVEIKEKAMENSGRDTRLFMKRGKLPKSLKDPEGEFYTEKDFMIGYAISVFNRRFVIVDMDQNTQRYFTEKYGLTDFQPITKYNSKSEKPAAPEIPPYNGFGSEEDSLSCFSSLIPKPPKVNIKKMIENEGKMLRFIGVLDTEHPVDKDRRFIISYNLGDDKFIVFEQAQRNSGLQSGKFLERVRCKKPGSSEYYGPADLFVGNVLELYANKFILTDADEYTYKYMECCDDEFPKSNIDRVLQRVRALVLTAEVDMAAALAKFETAEGVVSSDDFRTALLALPTPTESEPLAEHEIITLLRRFDLQQTGSINYKNFLKTIS